MKLVDELRETTKKSKGIYEKLIGKAMDDAVVPTVVSFLKKASEKGYYYTTDISNLKGRCSIHKIFKKNNKESKQMLFKFFTNKVFVEELRKRQEFKNISIKTNGVEISFDWNPKQKR